MTRCARAFSLIELLVVLLIMASVMSVILACFDGGFRVYARVSAFGGGEANAHLAGEYIEQDLKNALFLPGDAYSGVWVQNRMEFVTVMTGRVGVVRYGPGPDAVLERSFRSLESDLFSVPERLLDTGFTVHLRYSGNGKRTPAGLGRDWMGEWVSTTNLPQAVRIDIDGVLLEDGGVVRTVWMPGGD